MCGCCLRNSAVQREYGILRSLVSHFRGLRAKVKMRKEINGRILGEVGGR